MVAKKGDWRNHDALKELLCDQTLGLANNIEQMSKLDKSQEVASDFEIRQSRGAAKAVEVARRALPQCRERDEVNA